MLPQIQREWQYFTWRQIPLEQEGLDSENIRNFLEFIQKKSSCSGALSRVLAAAKSLSHLKGYKEWLCPVTRFLLASSGQLSLRVTIAEPVSTRKIQIRGLKTFKMLFYIYLYLFVRASIPITDFFIPMASPRGLSSQFSVWSCSNFQLGFCWNLRIWQQNLHTRPASPTCWDPALPQNNSWESSHKQHHFCTLPLGGGHQEKAPNPPSKQKFLNFKSLLLVSRQWDWVENLIFDFARVSFHLFAFFFASTQSRWNWDLSWT